MSMRVKVDMKVDRAEVNRMLRGQGGLVVDGLNQACRNTVNRAKANITAAGRVDTGALRNNIDYEIEQGPSGPVGVVRANQEYARHVHDGTGIYGRGRPIVPRRARVLRFTPKGGSKAVYARSVKGSPGTPFLTDALKALRLSDFTS